MEVRSVLIRNCKKIKHLFLKRWLWSTVYHLDAADWLCIYNRLFHWVEKICKNWVHNQVIFMWFWVHPNEHGWSSGFQKNSHHDQPVVYPRVLNPGWGRARMIFIGVAGWCQLNLWSFLTILFSSWRLKRKRRYVGRGKHAADKHTNKTKMRAGKAVILYLGPGGAFLKLSAH